MQSIKLNSRVKYLQDTGIIRAIIDKEDGNGFIVGLELDKPSDHGSNGSFEGKQYFKCDGGHGLFIPIDDLSIFESSFLDALRLRYVEGFIDKDDVRQIIDRGDGIGEISRLIIGHVGGKDVEFVSKDKKDFRLSDVETDLNESNHEATRYCECICLNNFNISTVDVSEAEFEKYTFFHNADEIDLTDNLIRDWAETKGIFNNFKNLGNLNLSHNTLSFDSASSFDFYCPTLKILTLNYTTIQWSDILTIAERIPNVEELHLCYNEIQDISVKPDEDLASLLPNLKFLNLEGNKIQTWEQTQTLLSIPNLTKLSLNHNPITYINNDIRFDHLASLAITGCPIQSWGEVKKLSEYKSLEELYLKSPSLGEFDKFSRLHTIALLDNLKRLNGSDILKKEKEEATKLYIQRIIKAQKGASLEEINASDSTFQRIYATHKKEVVEFYNKVHNIVEEFTTKTGPIEVRFKSDLTEKTFTKRLPLSTNILRVKLLAGGLFKCDVKKVELYIEEEGIDSDEKTKTKIESSIDSLGDYTTTGRPLTLVCEW